jgi:hypothetical protein
MPSEIVLRQLREAELCVRRALKKDQDENACREGGCGL